MTNTIFPITHLVSVSNLRPDGLSVSITTTPEQRAQIAELLELPSVEALSGEFTLTPAKKGMVIVKGTVTANVHQTCVVTLDAFETAIKEQVDLEFIPTDDKIPNAKSSTQKPDSKQKEKIAKPIPEQDMEDIDPPDLIIDGHIDLGAVTVEFLALGLDPFPRKPNAEFNYIDPTDEKENPFAKLIKLVPKE
jgi:uncharacterized metal-binding protein YceD (DUF177 family)